MAYKPSESRYDKGDRVLYLEYASPTRRPARVKRIYLPGDSSNVRLEGPKMLRKRTGRRVYGVALHYEHEVAGVRGTRDSARRAMPQRRAARTQIIELPGGAKELRLSDRPPEGLISVA